MKHNKTELGLEIAKRRKLAGFTQNDLAEKLDIKRSSLASYEVGANYPPKPVLSKIEKILGKILYDESENIKYYDLSLYELFDLQLSTNLSRAIKTKALKLLQNHEDLKSKAIKALNKCMPYFAIF